MDSSSPHPNHPSMDIEELNNLIGGNKFEQQSLFNRMSKNKNEQAKMIPFLRDLMQHQGSFDKHMIHLKKKYKINPKKAQMSFLYWRMKVNNMIEPHPAIEQFLWTKPIRGSSGVTVITVVTSPGSFSCPKNCYYCPDEPGQPRSYLSEEPGVKRANRHKFDAISQFQSRAMAHFINGQPVDKIEVLVLGGTWSGYPHDYQVEFIRDLYYAANTFYDMVNNPDSSSSSSTSSYQEEDDDGNLVTNQDMDKMFDPRINSRLAKSMTEEQKINENAFCRIIGLTLETRPDYITSTELKRLRSYGCTRVQIGVQHTDNEILELINREHTVEDSMKGIKRLKEVGFKVDIHLMPNLPGSDPDKDREMFNMVITHPGLQADQWKIYPTEITPWTKIKEWHESGDYIPYSEEELIEILMEVKSKIAPDKRINRLMRDIPSQYIVAGIDMPHMRQVIQKKMEERGWKCHCIRCREVRGKIGNVQLAEMKIRTHEASDGLEYFISFESPCESIIYGFLRLRINEDPNKNVFSELRNTAIVRELHVYGFTIPVSNTSDNSSSSATSHMHSTMENRSQGSSQHMGFGKRLMQKAEQIALDKHHLEKMAVISGIGVRNYYQKLGYQLEGTYMTKILKKDKIVERIPTSILFYYLKHTWTRLNKMTDWEIFLIAHLVVVFLYLLTWLMKLLFTGNN